MVKAKDFWKYISKDLGFTLFSGVPCTDFKPLYDNMDSSIMHYIPAASETVALGIINGFWFTGQYGAVMLHTNQLYKLFPVLERVNIRYGIPTLIMVPELPGYLPKDVRTGIFSKKAALKLLVDEMLQRRLPGVIEMKGGFK